MKYLVEVENCREGTTGSPSVGPAYRSVFAKDGFPPPVPGVNSCWDVFRLALSLIPSFFHFPSFFGFQAISEIIWELFDYFDWYGMPLWMWWFFLSSLSVERNPGNRMLGRREIVDGKVRNSMMDVHCISVIYIRDNQTLWIVTGGEIFVANLQRSVRHGDESWNFYSKLRSWAG